MLLAGYGQALAQIFAERVLNSMLNGILLALFGWVLLRVLARQNSSTRFAIWFSTMLAVAALPLFGNMSFGSASTLAHAAFHLPAFWAAEIFAVWAVLAAAGLAKIGFSFWRLRTLRQSCTEIDSAILFPALHQTLSDFGRSRHVTLCTSDHVRVPAAIGFTKPAIVLPSWALHELSPDELNSVVLHESAHLRRRDDWTNLVQEILKALFFFHPAVWWIGRGLSLEREMACDDFVLAATSNPRAYAQCLVSVAEKTFLRRGLALAQAIAGKLQQTTRRVTRILDTDRPVATGICKPALALVAAFSALCLLSLPHAPRLVAFEGTVPGLSASAGFPGLVVDAPGVGAKLIPAAFHSPASKSSPQKHPAPSVLSHTTRLQSGKTNHAAAPIDQTNRNFLARQNNRPELIDANASAANFIDVDYPQSVLLVIQTEQVDGDGRVWSFSLVQLTVFHPVNRQVQKGIIPKST